MVSAKRHGGKSVLDRLHQKGSLKLLFPRSSNAALTGVLLNTAGGVTGGDRFECQATTAPHCDMVLTTQAAERAYRAQPGETGHLTTRLTLGSQSTLHWLPQETLIFDRSALNRRLTIDMAKDATFLMVEPVILGRPEMGETLGDLAFHDRVTLRRDGDLLFADRTRIAGDTLPRRAGPALFGGSGAMASVVLAAPDAEAQLNAARAMMPATAGVSLIRDGLLVARLLASDGFALRQSLVPLIELLAGRAMPRTWMI
jgi:urease accessory protein